MHISETILLPKITFEIMIRLLLVLGLKIYFFLHFLTIIFALSKVNVERIQMLGMIVLCCRTVDHSVNLNIVLFTESSYSCCGSHPSCTIKSKVFCLIIINRIKDNVP